MAGLNYLLGFRKVLSYNDIDVVVRNLHIFGHTWILSCSYPCQSRDGWDSNPPKADLETAASPLGPPSLARLTQGLIVEHVEKSQAHIVVRQVYHLPEPQCPA
jgi:hypothetical protein